MTHSGTKTTCIVLPTYNVRDKETVLDDGLPGSRPTGLGHAYGHAKTGSQRTRIEEND